MRTKFLAGADTGQVAVLGRGEPLAADVRGQSHESTLLPDDRLEPLGIVYASCTVQSSGEARW
jgi:hypothetical protein